MKAADIMRQPVLATTPRTSVHDVLAQLVMNSISGMPVIEQDGSVIGIITEGDILRTHVEYGMLGNLAVQDIMSQNPVTVDIETPLAEVMQSMYDEGVLRVPVVENGRLVGIISRGDIVMALAQPVYLGDSEFSLCYRQYHEQPDEREAATPVAHPASTFG